MNTVNKIGIGVSVLSLAVIAGSLYYNNEQLLKASNNIVVRNNTAKETDVESKKNIDIKTEIINNKLVVTIKNVSNRELIDVVLESGVKDSKLAEVYLEKFASNAEKIIEIPLDRNLSSQSIRNNNTVVNEYRLVEEAEFTYNSNKGYVLVTSLKEQKIDYYRDKINSSNLTQSEKDQLLTSIAKNNNINNVEKLLEGKVIPLLNLSPDVTVFSSDEDRLVISEKTLDEGQAQSINNGGVDNQNTPSQSVQSSMPQYVAPNNGTVNQSTRQQRVPNSQGDAGTNSNNTTP